MFEEIIRKAKEWRGKICTCSRCYSDKVALIFPPLGQKIMFISESPYKFPRDGCGTLGDFIDKDLYKEIEKIKGTSKSITSIPRNIFDFIYKTFKPLFSDEPKMEDIAKFLRTVYWTHIAKKSLKDLDKEECAKMCSEATFKELKEVHPELIVVASYIALGRIFGRGYVESLDKQRDKIRKKGELLTVGELIFEKREPLISRIRDLKDRNVAVFPNPSPRTRKWKKKAYVESKEEIKKVLEHIHLAL